MNKETTKVHVDSGAEAVIIELLSNIFDDVAYMDPATVRQNIELATSGGFSKSDRSIRAGLANYLISHFALIYTGLVVNKEFRETFKDAVDLEICFDNVSPYEKASIRNTMSDGKPVSSKGSFVIDTGRYSDSVYKKLNEKLSLSFSKLTKHDETISQAINDLSDDDKIIIGFCVSNFMYLIRAFDKNSTFKNYVRYIIESVSQTLNVL